MNMKTRTKAWGLALGLLAIASSARAVTTNPARLNIEVTITQNLSVVVNEVASSTQTVPWNAANPNDRLVSPSSVTVRNDSGAQTERWQLSTNLNSIPASGTDKWTVSGDSTAVGSEQFALQAVFGSSNTASNGCPVFNSPDWDLAMAEEVTDTPATYTSARFADPNLAAGGGTPNPDVAGSGRMLANSKRALCWRVIAPASTVATAAQTIQLIVTALAP
jgi:hypothetical protein